MLTVTICDNVCIYCNTLYEMLKRYLDQHNISALIKTYNDSTELYRDPIASNIYVLDMTLSQLSSRELAIRLHTKYPHAKFIFVSKDASKLEDTYDTDYVAYLLKPVDPKYLGLALDKAIKQLKREICLIHTPDGDVQVRYDEIVYANQINRALEYHLISGEVVRTTVLHQSAQQAYGAIVKKPEFMFLPPSQVINLAQIKMLSGDHALMYTGETVYFTKKNYKALREKWGRAIGEGMSGAENGFY